MTLQAKPKQCSFCGQLKRLWKAHPPTCQDCNGRNKQAASESLWMDYEKAAEVIDAMNTNDMKLLRNPPPYRNSTLKVKPKPTINGKPVHTAIYMAAFGYGDTDFIPSEISGERAVDVHHIKAGNKREDRIENLMGLTRSEHSDYGDKKHLMAFLYRKHLQFMLHCGVKFDRAWIEGEIERWTAEEIIP